MDTMVWTNKHTLPPQPPPPRHCTPTFSPDSYDYEGVEKAGAEAMFAAMVRMLYI